MIIGLLTWEYPIFLLSSSYLHPAFYMLLSRYLSRNHLVTIPIPLCYHSITIQYFPRTLPPVKGSALTRRINILLLPRLVVEYAVFSLFLIPESYSGISVMVLPLSVHAEYPCAAIVCQVLGGSSPSQYSSIASTCSRVFCSFFVSYSRIIFGYSRL